MGADATRPDKIFIAADETSAFDDPDSIFCFERPISLHLGQ
jgi:hypothetical protein